MLGFQVLLGSIGPQNGPLYIALLDPTVNPPGWQLKTEGPGVVSGSM
ncbi:MAG: hypothetical protein ABI182_00585 [Candidatus Baltobacteraceae bacterium]